MKNSIIKRFAMGFATAFVFSVIFNTQALAQTTPKLTEPEIASVALVAN
jgi:hypothetical protein